MAFVLFCERTTYYKPICCFHSPANISAFHWYVFM